VLDSFVEGSKNEVTFFFDKTRYATTILDDSGKRIVGTDASEAVYEAVVKNGEDYEASNVPVNGNPYYAAYVPMKNGNQIVGFCFTEDPATDVYFSLRPGYESIADEMILWADTQMPGDPSSRRFVLFAGQTALIDAAERAGYVQTHSTTHRQYFFDQPLDYPLPSGFRFTAPGNVNVEKACECCYKGFGHEEEDGPWDGYSEHGYHLGSAPHATPEHAIAIENESGDYVCYADMWWTPENRLAYMEPLCTVPEYRGRGLASALLSELARRMHALGAAQMTGGSNPFYEKIGFKPADEWTFWKKR
jgi:GNAT superfamily N-acetyltransferase